MKRVGFSYGPCCTVDVSILGRCRHLVPTVRLGGEPDSIALQNRVLEK
jgi:hypothetical protein